MAERFTERPWSKWWSMRLYGRMPDFLDHFPILRMTSLSMPAAARSVVPPGRRLRSVYVCQPTTPAGRSMVSRSYKRKSARVIFGRGEPLRLR